MWGEIEHFLAYKKNTRHPPKLLFFSKPLPKRPFGIGYQREKISENVMIPLSFRAKSSESFTI